MKNKYLLFLIFILLVNVSFAQSNDSILVDLGTKKITVDEFVKRFELTPWPRRNIKYIDTTLKQEFLNTLIAEKLLSIYGEQIKLDTVYELTQAFKNLEKMIIRDALYRKEIKNKVKLSEEEKNNAFAKSQITFYVKYIFAQDSAYIFNLYNKLLNGQDFDSTLFTRPEYESQKFPMEVTYGTLREEIENEIYKTNTGEITRPLFSGKGYYIFKIDSSRFAITLGPKKMSDSYRKAEKILKQRTEEKLYNEYFKKFFSKKRAEADGTVFWILANEIIERFKSKFATQRPLHDNSYFLDPDDVAEIEKKLGNQTKLNLIKLDKRNIPINDFLRALLFKGFSVDDTSRIYIATKLNKSIKSFIEDEFLAEEGYRQNLHLIPEVKNEIEMWKDSYYYMWVSQGLRKNIEVTEEEVIQYIKNRFIRSPEVILVNVQEILVDSLDQVEMILNKLKDGEDFGELAQKYSKRKWAAEKKGEFGFFPTNLYEEIGRVAEKLNIGEIFAPIETKEGYSIIKLLDKKIEKPNEKTIDFTELKDKIAKELKEKKFNEQRDKLVAELAQQHIKNINFELLNSTKVTALNMFVYRYMGFGGKMTAVPIIAPYTSWFEIFKKSQKTLP